jgi:hypothetical protein
VFLSAATRRRVPRLPCKLGGSYGALVTRLLARAICILRVSLCILCVYVRECVCAGRRERERERESVCVSEGALCGGAGVRLCFVRQEMQFRGCFYLLKRIKKNKWRGVKNNADQCH